MKVESNDTAINAALDTGLRESVAAQTPAEIKKAVESKLPEGEKVVVRQKDENTVVVQRQLNG